MFSGAFDFFPQVERVFLSLLWSHFFYPALLDKLSPLLMGKLGCCREPRCKNSFWGRRCVFSAPLPRNHLPSPFAWSSLFYRIRAGAVYSLSSPCLFSPSWRDGTLLFLRSLSTYSPPTLYAQNQEVKPSPLRQDTFQGPYLHVR